jgi:3-methyl-2-oxobutanoate hydroxymethyltransferase
VPHKLSVAALQQMKREGQKIVAVVVYDFPMAQIVDRAGVDIVSVGDSVGKNVWGHASQREVTLDQMLLACKAVRHGVRRALVSCDFPYGPAQRGPDAAVKAARTLYEDGGADLIKVDDAVECPEVVRAITRAHIPVWAQFSGPGGEARETGEFVAHARLLEEAGAVMLDFIHSGPAAGPAVVSAVEIPVLGGLGGGPWLDGRVRSIVNAVGYSAVALDDRTERYANIARVALEAIETYAGDVRAGRQIKGEPAGSGGPGRR